jgi:hypothetical protein
MIGIMSPAQNHGPATGLPTVPIGSPFRAARPKSAGQPGAMPPVTVLRQVIASARHA